jgi:hypothetical protein
LQRFHRRSVAGEGPLPSELVPSAPKSNTFPHFSQVPSQKIRVEADICAPSPSQGYNVTGHGQKISLERGSRYTSKKNPGKRPSKAVDRTSVLAAGWNAKRF